MRPSPRLVAILLGGLPLALLPSFLGAIATAAWISYLALVVLASVLDALLAPRRGAVRVDVAAPAGIFAGESGTAVVTVDPGRRRGARVHVLLDLDPEFDAQPEREGRARPGAPATVEFTLVPRRRGKPAIRTVLLRWRGPFGLLERRRHDAVSRVVAVVPNLRPVRAAAMRFFTEREFLAGTKPERWVGDGTEFDSLREHVAGLDPRSIDWKATARHRRLLSREYRAEQDHRVVIAIDTGRLMRDPIQGLPRLDHAIHAGLLLAYVALRSGDRVGLYAFDERARVFVEPQGGLAAFPRLQAGASGLSYSTAETNFTLGLVELSARLRRRSLVVVLTDFVDAVTAELMVQNLALLRGRHLVVFAALRDPGLEAMALAEPRSDLDLHRAVVAGDLLRDRGAVLSRLRRRGVRTVDATPQEVSAGLLQRYLDVRRRELVG